MEPHSDRVLYDENDNNGMALENLYIPPEIFSRIFTCYVDCSSLMNCQLVCKRWKELLQSYDWRKKAEIVNNCHLPQDLHWQDYYLMTVKKPFQRNLINNHSGQNLYVGWSNVNGDWTIESPPIGVPLLPKDPHFGDQQHCFVSTYRICSKEQIIDLEKEGIPKSILDNFQPIITISEWISARWDCSAKYKIQVELIGDNENELLDVFVLNKILRNETQNVWLEVKHVFKDYGKGLRKIRFSHCGKDEHFWDGHYGSKMARACVTIAIPKQSCPQTLQ